MHNNGKHLDVGQQLDDDRASAVNSTPMEYDPAGELKPDKVDGTGASVPPEYLSSEGAGGAVFIRNPSVAIRKACKGLDNTILNTDVYHFCHQLNEKGMGRGAHPGNSAQPRSVGSVDSSLRREDSDHDSTAAHQTNNLDVESEEEEELYSEDERKEPTSTVPPSSADELPTDHESVPEEEEREHTSDLNTGHDSDKKEERPLVSPLSNCTDSDSETGLEQENKLRATLEILLFPREHTQLENGAKLLSKFKELLGEDIGHRKHESRIEKVLREIYRAMADFPEDEVLIERACRLIGKLVTGVPDVYGAITVTGGVAHIMQAMKRHTEGVSVHDAAIFTLLTITQEEAGRKAIIEERGAEYVTHMINKFLDERSIATNGSLTLGNLAFGEEENKKRIGKVGGIDAVVNAMYNHSFDVTLQARCCLALRNLTFGSRANQWIAGRAGAMEVIVRSMKTFPENKELHYQGLVSLVNILSDESRNRERASDINVVSVCLDIMKNGVENTVIIEHGLAVLRNLSIENEENQLCIGDGGGVQLVMQCLEMYRTRERILIKGCSALRYLFFARRNREIMSGSAKLELLVRILRDGAGIPEVAENAILALGNATFDQYESKRTIARYGGICAVVDVMCNHLDMENLQAYGCRALRNLADCDELNVRLLGESGAVDAAIYAIMGYKENEDIQEQAFAMLFNIAFSEQNLRLMRDLEVARIVEHALMFHTQNARIQLQASALLQRLKPLEQSNSQYSSPRGSSRLLWKKSQPFSKKSHVFASSQGRSRTIRGRRESVMQPGLMMQK